MQQTVGQTVVDKDGVQGVVVSAPETESGTENLWIEGASFLVVRLKNGEQVSVPTATLTAQGNGFLYFPASLMALENQAVTAEEPAEEHVVISALAETLQVQKQTIETGRVIISKQVQERAELVDLPLLQETVEVERIAINRVVNEPVAIRYENDTMIISVLEEVLVVEKRLMLKEELHVKKRRSEVHSPQTVTLRSEEVLVERTEN